MPLLNKHKLICCTIFFSLLTTLTSAENPIVILDVTQEQETCELGNGSLTINIQGSTTGLSYSIDNGATFQSSNEFKNLKSGDYIIVVTDGVCREKRSAQIGDAPEPRVELVGECLSGKNRVLLTTITEDGIPPFSYNWIGPNNATYTGETLTEVLPGKYNVTVTDGLGCTFSDSLTLDQCCYLDLSCNLQNEVFYCEGELPEVPAIFSTPAVKEDYIQELATLGIAVETGSCGDLSVVVTETTNNPTTCDQDTLRVLRSYAISDSHTDYTCTQEFIVVDYITTSLITEASDASASCPENINSSFQAWLDNVGGMTYLACSEPVTVTTIPAVPSIIEECGSSVEVTFIVVDGCGKQVQSTANFSIEDNTAPELTCPTDLVVIPSDPNINEILEAWIGEAEAIDNCTTGLLVSNDFDTDLNGLCELTDPIVVNFTTSDFCGLTAECTARIEVSGGQPNLICPDPLSINCADNNLNDLIDTWSLTAVATFSGMNPIMVELPDFSNEDLCNNTFPVTFSITNDCYLSSQCESSITITDTEAPEINCPSPVTFNVHEGDIEAEIRNWISEASATDCNNFELVNDAELADITETCGDVMPVNFYATDECGNISNCVGMLTLVNASTITMTCPEPITTICSEINIETMANSLMAQTEISSLNTVELEYYYDENEFPGDCTELMEFEFVVYSFDKCNNDDECTTSITVIPEPDIYIPNVFSPDNDGVNDYFTVYTNSSVVALNSLQIYNKWGNLVFTKENTAPNVDKQGWDGRYEGKMLATDVYTYHFVLTDIMGEEIIKTGTIQLMKN